MKRFITFMLIAVMLISLVACNQKADNETPSLEGVDKPWMTHYTEDMKDITLNIYSVSDITDTLALFTADTGIKAEVLHMKNGEILERVKNEKNSGNVLADIWYRGGADTFINAAAEGYFMKYVSPEAKFFADDAKDANGYWTGTTMTLVGWVVNLAVLEELGVDVPKTWDDLLNPKLKNMISMSDPASSGTAYNTVSAILQTRGEETGWDYLDKLIDQVPFFTPRGSDPTNLTQAGEVAIGIIATFGEKEMRGDANPIIKLIYPEDGTGWWPQPLAILEGAKNAQAAKVFVDWVLSERGMSLLSEMDSVLALRDGLPVPDSIYKLSEVTLFPTDFQENAARRDEILEKWNLRVTQSGK